MQGQRTIVSLLAVVAVLLGLNLAVTLPGQKVQAQPPVTPPGMQYRPVRPVGIAVPSDGTLYRLWSDGSVDRNSAPAGVDGQLRGWEGWKNILEPPQWVPARP